MAVETEQFARIESLTDQLLSAAEAESWDEAFAIEAERRPLIETFFSQLPENRRAGFRSRVEAIAAKDRRVMSLGQAHKQAVGEALNRLGKGKQAVKAYQDQI